MASRPGSITCSGGATRVHAVAEYVLSLASMNCGDPSLERNQSDNSARTRTGSAPVLTIVIAWVVVAPACAFNSTRSGDTSIDTCAEAGSADTHSANSVVHNPRFIVMDIAPSPSSYGDDNVNVSVWV